MNLEACTKVPCSASRVQSALGLKNTSCEGKGSCWLIAALAAFENLIKTPRNLTLADRGVDLSCRHEVLLRFTRILSEPDDALGGLLHAEACCTVKVERSDLWYHLLLRHARPGKLLRCIFQA